MKKITEIQPFYSCPAPADYKPCFDLKKAVGLLQAAEHSSGATVFAAEVCGRPWSSRRAVSAWNSSGVHHMGESLNFRTNIANTYVCINIYKYIARLDKRLEKKIIV